MASETIAEQLGKLISEITYLVAHPRIQQKTWVANGKRWLPILEIAKAAILSSSEAKDTSNEAYQAVMDILPRLGLRILKRDPATWGYSWHNEPMKGAYPSVAQAVEAALKERLP